MTSLPEKFEQSMRNRLGSDFANFKTRLAEAPPVSIRMHPLKNKRAMEAEPVPWTSAGRYLQQRPSFTLDPFFHGGSYYVQEASSMFLEQALKQTVDLNAPLRILDLCAAPGGKSTHVLSLLQRESLLVSNEVIRSRASVLAENIQKWGYPNAVVTQNDPSDFRKLAGFFDVMVIDAPCSGEGMFRKDPAAALEWSPENVQLCCGRQKRILADAWDALREEGVMIYCTCTYNALENEENMKWLGEHYAVEFIRLKTDPSWGVEEVQAGRAVGYRFFPHRLKGEGFFLSVVKKTQGSQTTRTKAKSTVATPLKKIQERLHAWVLRPEESDFFQFKDLIFYTSAAISREVEFLLQQFRIVYAGTNIATLKHDKLIPEHSLSLSVEINRKNFPEVELGEEAALNYLRREPIALPDKAMGFTLVNFQDLPIGWVNILSNRVNNLYPQEWRIRKKAE